MKWCTVCLCFGFVKCLQTTQELAKRNEAIDFRIVEVEAPYSMKPAYRGEIYVKEV